MSVLTQICENSIHTIVVNGTKLGYKKGSSRALITKCYKGFQKCKVIMYEMVDVKI